MNGGFTIKTIPNKTVKMLKRSNFKIGSFRNSLAEMTVKIGAVASIGLVTLSNWALIERFTDLGKQNFPMVVSVVN